MIPSRKLPNELISKIHTIETERVGLPLREHKRQGRSVAAGPSTASGRELLAVSPWVGVAAVVAPAIGGRWEPSSLDGRMGAVEGVAACWCWKGTHAPPVREDLLHESPAAARKLQGFPNPAIPTAGLLHGSVIGAMKLLVRRRISKLGAP